MISLVAWKPGCWGFGGKGKAPTTLSGRAVTEPWEDPSHASIYTRIDTYVKMVRKKHKPNSYLNQERKDPSSIQEQYAIHYYKL
jgi:hypothetical protein